MTLGTTVPTPAVATDPLSITVMYDPWSSGSRRSTRASSTCADAAEWPPPAMDPARGWSEPPAPRRRRLGRLRRRPSTNRPPPSSRVPDAGRNGLPPSPPPRPQPPTARCDGAAAGAGASGDATAADDGGSTMGRGEKRCGAGGDRLHPGRACHCHRHRLPRRDRPRAATRPCRRLCHGDGVGQLRRPLDATSAIGTRRRRGG